MFQLKLLICLLLVFVATVVLIPIIHFMFFVGVYVSVTNNSQSVLSEITVDYTGGSLNIAELEPKNSYGQRIDPNGASHLQIKWLDSSGEKRSAMIDVYFEGGYSGSVEINIDPNNDVFWTDDIRLY